MIRIVIENILLFLLPLAMYLAYVLVAQKKDARGALDEAPLVWLFVAGGLLVIVVLIAFGNTSGGKPGEAYQPPVLKDGRIEPGRIK